MPEKISWKHHAYHVAILVGCAFACIWLYFQPKSGKAVLVIGGLAILMLLADLSPRLKAVYVVVVVGLMLAENHALNIERADAMRERTDAIREEAKREKEENDRFEAIAKGLDRTLEDSDRKFAATTAKTNEILNDITGGRSFAVVTPQVWGGEYPIPLVISNRGTNTLTGVVAVITGVKDWHKPHGLYEAQTINVGTLHGKELKLLPQTISPQDDGFRDEGRKVSRFTISISAQNFTVEETLVFREGKSIPWTFQYLVTRQYVKSQQGKTTNFGYEIMAREMRWIGEN
jgi:hypothetical protein